MIYALDTNIVSYMIKGDIQVRNKLKEVTDVGNTCVIPAIVYYEIKRGLLAINATTKLRFFDELWNQFDVGAMNLDAWSKAAELYSNLRKNGRTVEDADLFIAAYCIVNDYVLVTNNTRHFEVIDGLQYINWK